MALGWKLTDKGLKLADAYEEVFNGVNGVCFDGYNVRSFDAEGFDRDGANMFGYTATGEYVGIHHLFRKYYGPSYFGK